jgi:competence protein ComEC
MLSVETCTGLVNQLLPEPEAGLLAGILLGVKATMDRSLYNALINTGTLHIVALSGANISILSGLISSTLLKIQISRRIVGLLSCFLIIGFVGFVGPSPSVVRAAIMACLVLLGNVLGKSVWPIWTWIVTVGIMLSLSPRLAIDISFQLSAGATLGIIIFGQKNIVRTHESGSIKHENNPVESSIHNSFFIIPTSIIRLWSYSLKFCTSLFHIVENDLRLTLSAQVFTIPIIFFHFHRISLISPLPNLLIGWVLPPLTGIGYLIVVAGLIWKPIGQLLAWLIYFPLLYIIWIIELFSKIPLASVGF